MSLRRSRLTGYAELMDLAGRARVPRNEKAVLKALVQFADWATGRNSRAYVDTIAASAGYKRRQTGILLDRLDARGLIVFAYKSKGGNGRPHIIDINVHQLRVLATEEGSGDDCNEVTPEPRIPHHSTAHSATINRARSAHDQGNTKSNTNPPKPRRALKVAKRPTASESGGGVDVSLGDQESAEEMLLHEGVWPSTASVLSTTYSSKLVASAIGLVDGSYRAPYDRPAMIVHKLKSGKAQESLDEAERKEQRTEERKRQAHRMDKCRALKGNLEIFKGAPEGPQVGEMLRVVHAVWPTVGQIAEGAILSDAEWNLADTDPLRLLGLLAQAANEYAECCSASQETRRSIAARSGVIS